MGLNQNGTRALLYAKSINVDFSHSAMIGRQRLKLNPVKLQKILKEFHLVIQPERIARIFSAEDGYAENLLVFLGAIEVHSFDISDYEGATFIHDMNKPIGDEFKQRYSLVIDGGSLEHVFNFPIAIKNCMEMVSVGGHFLSITPTNNYSGHGFYQFSPEIFYSIFIPANGYELCAVILYENKRNARWFAVSNPQTIKRRVKFINNVPSYLLVIARRTVKCPIFTTMPQQSDYSSIWRNINGHGRVNGNGNGKGKKRSISRYLDRMLVRCVPFRRRKYDPELFSPFDYTNTKGLDL